MTIETDLVDDRDEAAHLRALLAERDAEIEDLKTALAAALEASIREPREADHGVRHVKCAECGGTGYNDDNADSVYRKVCLPCDGHGRIELTQTDVWFEVPISPECEILTVDPASMKRTGQYARARLVWEG